MKIFYRCLSLNTYYLLDPHITVISEIGLSDFEPIIEELEVYNTLTIAVLLSFRGWIRK